MHTYEFLINLNIISAYLGTKLLQLNMKELFSNCHILYEPPKHES